MKRYFITDRKAAGGTEELLEVIKRQLRQGIDMIQVREKDLSACELFGLTVEIVRLREDHAIGCEASTKILVNSRSDVAIAAGADGVHLPAAAPRQILPGMIVVRSCHSVAEVQRASGHADAVVLGPIFDSPGKGPPIGLATIREACRFQTPVYALGGINWANAEACIEAGAAGIAAVRLFQETR